jgi:hypothetical protein
MTLKATVIDMTYSNEFYLYLFTGTNLERLPGYLEGFLTHLFQGHIEVFIGLGVQRV